MTSDFSTSNQRHIPVSVRPGHPVAVMSGGVGVVADVWEEVVAALRERGIDTVIVERPGTSWIESWKFGEMPTLESESCRIEDVLTDIRNIGAGPIILAVHSAAGFFAEAIALRRPELIDGIVLVDVSATGEALPAIPGLVRSSHLVGKVTGKSEVESLLLENAMFRFWARDLSDLRKQYAGRQYARTKLKPLEVVAILAESRFLPIRAAVLRVAFRSVVKQWRKLGAHVTQKILRPCGHNVMAERPDAVVAEIQKLVEAMRGNSNQK